MKIDTELLPIKAHFFFFFAALGPILPQLNVFGKQLGASPAAMGLVTAVLPLLWALAKPSFGYLVDYFTNQRKLVFMLLIGVMSGSYCGLWFLPTPLHRDGVEDIVESVYRMNDTVYLMRYDATKRAEPSAMDGLKKYNCQWNCLNRTAFAVWLTEGGSDVSYVNTLYVESVVNVTTCGSYYMDFEDMVSGLVKCRPKSGCDLNCFHASNDTIEQAMNNTNVVPKSSKTVDGAVSNTSKTADGAAAGRNKSEEISLSSLELDPIVDVHEQDSSFYVSATFWLFVVMMCVGTVAFNVANCIGDAVCFDVLGPERGNKYGSQRAWGTAGYGVTALLGGWLIDTFSHGHVKDFTPAFVLAITFTVFDLISCRKLNLPKLSSPSDSGRALRELLKMPRVLVFITFAIIAGIFDSFIIYYMFWYLEELAVLSGRVGQIKLIEGVIVAAQSFVGEILFFYLSGRIIKYWGHGVTMTVSLLCYALRLVIISLLTDPWILVFTEAIMQGPTYALMYSTIVGYAAHVAPEGYSATVQGIVAGMDDGLGFALGSLIGGQLYTWSGGAGAFRIMSVFGLLAAIVHGVLSRCVGDARAQVDAGNVKASEANGDEIDEQESEKMLYHHDDGRDVVYRDTVVAVNGPKARNGDRL